LWVISAPFLKEEAPMRGSTVLWTPSWRQNLADLIGNAQREVFLVSPWLKVSGARLIIQALKKSAATPGPRVRLLTTYNEEDFIGRSSASDLEAYSILLRAGVEIRAVRGLHAKTYVFDGESAFVTSANLTSAGLGFRSPYNLEIAVHVAVPEVAQLILSHLLPVWDCGEPLTCNLVQKTEQRIKSNPVPEADYSGKFEQLGPWWENNVTVQQPVANVKANGVPKVSKVPPPSPPVPKAAPAPPFTKGPDGKNPITASIEALRHKHWKCRVKAADTLRDFGPKAKVATPALIRALADQNLKVRFAATFALGNIDPEPKITIPALVNLLEDPSGEVCEAAENAILRLSFHQYQQVIALLIEEYKLKKSLLRSRVGDVLRRVAPKAAAKVGIRPTN
jgi:hypothetical protein